MTEKHFDKIADKYDQTLPQHVMAHYLNKRIDFIGRLGLGSFVLDVGCGTGSVLLELSKKGYKTIGVDFSERMLAQMREKGIYCGICAASLNLPFRDSVFDFVITIATLHHIADPANVQKTLREMGRVVKEGGAIVIWDHNELNPYWPFLMRKVPQDSGDERLIPAREIIQCLSKMDKITSVRLLHSGFVPDFIPRILLPIMQAIEYFLEKIPVLRNISAHNIIIAFKKG